jgi:5-methylcytosine-specific restriction endonuclease McrA
MYEWHTCPNCNRDVEVLCDGRILKSYEWCLVCKESHKLKDWEVRWFNHRFRVFTKKDIATRDGYKCYICKNFLGLTSKNSTIDHQVPLSRGGLSTFDNMRLCCTGCNNKKGDLLLEEYLLETANSP